MVSPLDQQQVVKHSHQPVGHQQPWCVQSHWNPFSSSVTCSLWSSARRHVQRHWVIAKWLMSYLWLYVGDWTLYLQLQEYCTYMSGGCKVLMRLIQCHQHVIVFLSLNCTPVKVQSGPQLCSLLYRMSLFSSCCFCCISVKYFSVFLTRTRTVVSECFATQQPRLICSCWLP